MLHNAYISCRTCNEKINIRIQVEENAISFIVNCPECSTEIYLEFNPSKNKDLIVKNASNLGDAPDLPLWCVELSAGLPVRKMYLRDSIIPPHGFDPFINTVMKLGKDEFLTVSNQITRLKESAQNGLFDDFIRINKLLRNGNKKYFLNETQKLLQNISNYTPIRKVDNLLDGVMVLHQNFISSGITILLENNALREYIKISERINSSLDKKQLLNYYSKYESTLNELENRSYSLVRDFIEALSQLSPVVLLMKTNKYREIDQDKYGISTAFYRDLKQLYVSSYEWLLDALDLVIALNNIVKRKDYSKCLKSKDFDSDLQTINSKYRKIDIFISDDEPFSKPLNNINNRVRNAIQHCSDEIDYVDQIISFYDKHKGKTRVEKISLMDFAKLCVENFAWIIYIMELIYDVRKVELVFAKGFRPSV